MRNLLSVFLILFQLSAFCQLYSDKGPENNFQSKQNPLYWKNRKPFEGYWQQDVHYKIKATIDETTDIITGSEQLTYFNNSPDTLYYVYFHLYQNAFQPGSYLDDLQRHNDAPVKYGKYEKQKLGILIDTITNKDSVALKKQLDNTRSEEHTSELQSRGLIS